jgi:hypothetical protein
MLVGITHGQTNFKNGMGSVLQDGIEHMATVDYGIQ